MALLYQHWILCHVRVNHFYVSEGILPYLAMLMQAHVGLQGQQDNDVAASPGFVGGVYGDVCSIISHRWMIGPEMLVKRRQSPPNRLHLYDNF